MRRGPVVIVVVVVVAVIAVVLVTGIGRRGPEVVLIGDSITAQTTEVFDDQLGKDWGLTVQGEPGHRADELVPAVAPLAQKHPVQVVINLGTNDVMQAKDPAQTQAALEQVAAGFNGARCIHLVTINDHMASLTDASLPARIADVNNRIRATAAAHGWHIVPWDEVVRLYDSGPQAEGPITTDTVHPTEYGEHLLAEAYGRALEGCQL
jgi:lysophospholipase L1-like esterase